MSAPPNPVVVPNANRAEAELVHERSATPPLGDLPSALPRPPGELAELERVWAPPRGWRLLTAVNNTHIGLYYIATA